MTEKVFKEVKPCGILHTFYEDYFLLSPEPVVKDSWQGDNCYRWIVVPDIPIEIQEKTELFSYARHIVSNAFTVEYKYNMKPIKVWQLEEYDLNATELQENPQYEVELNDEPVDLDYMDFLNQEINENEIEDVPF